MASWHRWFGEAATVPEAEVCTMVYSYDGVLRGVYCMILSGCSCAVGIVAD